VVGKYNMVRPQLKRTGAISYQTIQQETKERRRDTSTSGEGSVTCSTTHCTRVALTDLVYPIKRATPLMTGSNIGLDEPIVAPFPVATDDTGAEATQFTLVGIPSVRNAFMPYCTHCYNRTHCHRCYNFVLDLDFLLREGLDTTAHLTSTARGPTLCVLCKHYLEVGFTYDPHVRCTLSGALST